ncbi:PREDICTED: arylsulfatase H [Myotis davidii]|uniref:arylsulfatase H n=1 Tax=Myotis davidii TaxID=225400 RepID=UPI0003EBC19D|nr:PREDICTED: arylsulfatase H [Myotis davidii]
MSAITGYVSLSDRLAPVIITLSRSLRAVEMITESEAMPQPSGGRNFRLWVSLCGLFGSLRGTFVTRNSRPNIVLLMADDLGIGDLCCYGNNTVSTPNIDRLASEGVMLTQHLAAASMCTPSRAAFLTGRYPIRSGMASAFNMHRGIVWLGGSGGLPTNETTFAKLLQDRGYRTGLIGKWHQGLSCASRGDHCYHPLNHGFDYFYGMPFGLLSDCRASETPELHHRLRVTLGVSTAALALVPVLLLIPTCARWFVVPWGLILAIALLVLLFFLGWYSSYGFVRRWNCVLMRNHDIVQQPVREERVSSLLLREALAFVRRTPNIDSLAREGVQLTQHIAAASACTPSRSAFLTGRYPIRSGKWHQGLNCNFRNDHCRHPYHYGFDYFYGMPYSLFDTCWPDPSRDAELAISDRLWVCVQLVALAAVTLAVGKLSRMLCVPWALILFLVLLILLLGHFWLNSYQSTLYWDCLLMREQEITEQPMKAERAGSIMVKEAISFFER